MSNAQTLEILKEIFATQMSFGVDDETFSAILLGASVHFAHKSNMPGELFVKTARSTFSDES